MFSSLAPARRARSPSPRRARADATIDAIAQTLVPDAPAHPAVGSPTDATPRLTGRGPRHRATAPWARGLAAAVAVAGAAVRIEQFGWRRSLWLDEALLTANVVGRGFGGLLHPLSGQQGAPVGWLWAERGAVLVLGNNEYALRVVPLAAGIAALPLVWSVARRLLGPWPAALAVTALATSPAAVRYSVEVKQYSSDVAICLIVILLALRVAATRDRRAAWAWGGVGAAAVWCSHPAVLVLAGTATALVGAAAVARDRRGVRLIVGASWPWALSSAVDWWVSLRPLGHNTFLHHYWSAGFAPTPVAWRTLLPWLVRAPLHVLHDPGGLPVPPVAAAAVIAGLVVVVRRSPAAGAVVVAPLAVGLAAATVGGYPLVGRMALWLLPLLAVAIAAAAAGLAAAVNGRVAARRSAREVAARRWAAGVATGRPIGGVGGRRPWAGGVAAALAAAALVVPPAARVGRIAHDPTTWSDIRPLLQKVHAYLEPGDRVWAHAYDAPSAAYYAVATGVPLTAALYDGGPGAACPGSPALAAAAAGQRVWFVYGYHASTAPADEEAAVSAVLARLAHLVTRIRRPQATASLWDFSARPDAVSGSPPSAPLGCIGVVPLAVRPTGLTSGPLGSGHPT